jgi:hypothetical protein
MFSDGFASLLKTNGFVFYVVDWLKPVVHTHSKRRQRKKKNKRTKSNSQLLVSTFFLSFTTYFSSCHCSCHLYSHDERVYHSLIMLNRNRWMMAWCSSVVLRMRRKSFVYHQRQQCTRMCTFHLAYRHIGCVRTFEMDILLTVLVIIHSFIHPFIRSFVLLLYFRLFFSLISDKYEKQKGNREKKEKKIVLTMCMKLIIRRRRRRKEHQQAQEIERMYREWKRQNERERERDKESFRLDCYLYDGALPVSDRARIEWANNLSEPRYTLLCSNRRANVPVFNCTSWDTDSMFKTSAWSKLRKYSQAIYNHC